MKFYSTNNPSITVDLEQAVTQGLAPDNGLYMPETIPALQKDFFDKIEKKSFQEIGFAVAKNIIGNDIPESELKRIVEHTIQFDTPLVKVEDDVFALDLFHGPTLAFKDFGARFMSQLLGYFAKRQKQDIVILVATSGDTGSAVANGFLGVEGTRVVVLYPSGKVSEIQEKQFTTLGKNITSLEVDGTFDDCQRLVKQTFMDQELKKKFFLTSANSINIARLIPQSFYYFHAYAQLKDKTKPVVFSIPSGNFGNLTGGLFAKRMGLPIHQFIAATNANDVVPQYLLTKLFKARSSQQTISNAMDVGNPSNFDRILNLYNQNFEALANDIYGCAFTDGETQKAMQDVYAAKKYVMDPHGAIGYLGLKKYTSEVSGKVNGIFLETAHPAKFKNVVDETLGQEIEIPEPLLKFMKQTKQSTSISNDFDAFRNYLITNL